MDDGVRFRAHARPDRIDNLEAMGNDALHLVHGPSPADNLVEVMTITTAGKL
jgi:hypothetical protein